MENELRDLTPNIPNDGSPLVMSVTSELERRIRAGDLIAGRGLPSERELASEFSVSRVVIRSAVRILEQMGLVQCKARCRPIVRGTPGVIPLPISTNRRHISIRLWPRTAEFMAASILQGIQRTPLPDGIRLVVNGQSDDHFPAPVESEAAFLREIAADEESAGAIIWYIGGSRNLPGLQAVRNSGQAIVFIDRLPPDGFEADFVGSLNEDSAYLGVQHLIKLGHRRIALITNADHVCTVYDRERGYRRALADAKIPFLSDLVVQDTVDARIGVESALRQLLALPQPPSAVFCVNDVIALQVLESLQLLGLSVPNDISVVGFDGLLRWIPGGGNLTSAHQNFERMGHMAAELMLRRIESALPVAYRHVLLDAPVVVRASTGRPCTESASICKE